MKKQFDIKKLVLLNLPYLLMGLFATNFGEAWRLAQGANASQKFLSLFCIAIRNLVMIRYHDGHSFFLCKINLVDCSNSIVAGNQKFFSIGQCLLD